MKFHKTPLARAIPGIGSICLLSSGLASAAVYETEHTFSVLDLQGTGQGRNFGPRNTYNDAGILNWPRAICGIDVRGSEACPLDGPQPFVDKGGITLYPVNTKFAFDVVDFLGAQVVGINDGEYGEGWVGDITENGEVVGVKVSNAETDTYKVKPPLGTWCQGLGGTSIKCSTEHYTVMEHVLSCHETVPYFYADPVTGQQALLSFPDPADGTFDCTNAALDDNLLIIGGANDGLRLTSVTPLPEAGGQIYANDNTTVLSDIATGTDYSVTLKDDGKPLYRWGSLIKRPRDIRFYVPMPLPAQWKEPGVDYPVTRAELQITHWITNNPNDQVRPEDLENEAATGRQVSYQEEGDGSWTSLYDCYEGDGDYLPTEEGETDPVPIGAGTVLRQTDTYALDPMATPGTSRNDPPYAFSSDLVGAFTNAYYTSINRDPFEWSYVNVDDAAAGTYDFVGTQWPLSEAEMDAQNLELVSGPRWRLKANKFGQDIPGLEIPLIECSAPPFGHDNIKYEVGSIVTTVINLLDWDEATNGPSPLSSTRGWVDVTANDFVEVAGYQDKVEDGLDPVPFTTNSTPMTSDFDLVVYIKGDRKSTALYSARLVVETDEADALSVGD
ncbi:hypothetical protein E4634_10470 [Mangrovimicrobium sediminis]|uniref:Uncharacterized protein n=1 Tax=Mangrovimicrobium sediminis TaxID=2562682 RepID=A0A4Z0M1U1_9GAMM|nr:hypothetical protein [Haliea sp. SAOS-164]TGD73450.1 hypothetical protein E4634_10470 [Haliea sp. SAOS-164]